MKKLLYKIVFVIIVVTGCKKTGIDYPLLSSFTLVNATTDVASARGYAADHMISWKALPLTDAAAQYRSAHLGAFAGRNLVKAVSGADTTIVIYDNINKERDNFIDGRSNTLFLCGNNGTYQGVMLSNESFANYKDSVIGIRFINLSPNSTGVSINVAASGSNVVTGLVYKAKTEFQLYSASAKFTSGITFEVKNSSGTTLATYNLPMYPVSTYNTVGIGHSLFKNITLVIKGLQGTTSGTNAFGIFPVAHY